MVSPSAVGLRVLILLIPMSGLYCEEEGGVEASQFSGSDGQYEGNYELYGEGGGGGGYGGNGGRYNYRRGGGRYQADGAEEDDYGEGNKRYGGGYKGREETGDEYENEDNGGGGYEDRNRGGYGDDNGGGYEDDNRGGYGDGYENDNRGGYGDGYENDNRGGYGDGYENDNRGGYGDGYEDDNRGGYEDDNRGGYGGGYEDRNSGGYGGSQPASGPGTPCENGDSDLCGWWSALSTTYLHYEEADELIKDLQRAYPQFVQLYTIGKTVQGREMRVIKIGANVQAPRRLFTVPVKLVANTHGNEALGRSLLYLFIIDVIYKYQLGDSRAIQLLDSTEINVLPSTNPDGFEVSLEGECSAEDGHMNANGVDLAHDYPDPALTKGLPLESLFSGVQPETENIMRWIAGYYFVLSGELHGAETDDSDDNVPGFYIPAEEDVLKQIGDTFISAKKVKKCESGGDDVDYQGSVHSFSYLHSNTFSLAFELDCCAYPPASAIAQEWRNYNDSIWNFLDAAHWGIMGLVSDEAGNPIEGAQIFVDGFDHQVYSNNNGEYWRLLVSGTYSVWAEAKGFQPSQRQMVVITEGDSDDLYLQRRVDFILG